MYYNAWIPDDLREIITHQSKNIWTRNALGVQAVLPGMICQERKRYRQSATRQKGAVKYVSNPNCRGKKYLSYREDQPLNFMRKIKNIHDQQIVFWEEISSIENVMCYVRHRLTNHLHIFRRRRMNRLCHRLSLNQDSNNCNKSKWRRNL